VKGGGVSPIFIPSPIKKRGYSTDPPLQSPSETNRRQAGKEIHSIFTDLEHSVPRSKQKKNLSGLLLRVLLFRITKIPSYSCFLRNFDKKKRLIKTTN
jgi:hypothetical protein